MRNNNRNKGKNCKPNQTTQHVDKARDMRGNSSESYNDKTNATGSNKYNDPDWYVNSTQILNDAARLPYSIPVGTCFTRDGSVQPKDLSIETLPSYDNAIPGIFVSYLMPTLGSTDQTASSAVNVASNSLLQFIRSRISGSRHYEAVDVMIYMGAMDSLYCMITDMTRLYATAYTYHQANKYLSRALVEAQGVDYDDLIDNLPQFRTALNIELAKVRAMYLPSVLPIFKRHSWMFSHYFIEGDSEKDQIYFHAPAGYHYFKLDDDGKGALGSVCICHDSTKLKVADLLQMVRQMINPIFEREDFNIISGDLLKSYEGNVFTLTEIPDIATIQLSYSPEVLLQFKNAKYKNIPNNGDQDRHSWKSGFFNYYQNGTHHLTMFGNSVAKDALQYFSYVDSNDNVLVHTDFDEHAPYLMNGNLIEWSKDTMLTTPSHDVTPVENMINTRLTLAFSFTVDNNVSSGYRFDQLYFGSEWPVFYRLFAYHRNKSTGNITLFSRTYDRVLAVIDGNASTYWVASQEPIRSAFKYLPELSLIEYHHNAGEALHVAIPGRSIFEVDNYALVSSETVAGLHNAAILGEYNIPNLSIGK